MSHNIFTSILENCGVELSTDSLIAHVLKKEQCLVQRDLEKALTTEIRSEFVRDFKEYCQDEDNFKNALERMILQKNEQYDDLFQNSLFHLLLTVDEIKDPILDILLEKLPYKIVDNDVIFITCALKTLSSIVVNNDRLANSLIQYLDVADLATKIEMLNYFPGIISEKHFCNIVDKLLTLMEEEEGIAEQIIVCISSYNLTNEMKTYAVVFIMDKILCSKRYYKIFPELFNFLMDNSSNKLLIFDKIRVTLERALSDEKIEEAIKTNIHNKVKVGIIENKQLYDAILKNNPEEVLTIDIYFFMLLYICDKSKRPQIKTNLKKKIKNRLYRKELFENFFEKYLVPIILADFHKALIDISFCLIDANNMSVSIYGDIGTLIFKLMFNHPLCDIKMGNFMMEQIYFHLPKVDHYHHMIILQMLGDISMGQKLQDHLSRLVLLIELRSIFNLRNLKTLFGIICKNAVQAQPCVDEIQEVITKLLLKFDVNVIKAGIIAAVLLSKYLNESVETETPTENENSPLIQSLNLLKYTRNICKFKPECLGLFFDELALSISPKTHVILLNWLNEDIIDGFEQDYVVSDAEIIECPLALKPQFELNASSEVDQSMYINIGILLQNSLDNKKVTVLAPLFRLLRLVTFYLNDGSLGNVDALLGLGVLLPDLDNIETHGQEDLKIVATAIFHTINWFREVVDAFVDQSYSILKIKVIQRIKHIVDLEDKLDECMAMLVDHKLPNCYFYENSTTSEKPHGPAPSKRFKSQHQSIVANTTLTEGKSRLWFNEKVYYNFREINTGILILLKYPVTSEDMTASQMRSIQSKQFQFIVKDSVNKLATIITLRRSTECLRHIKPETLLNDCVKFMPYIQKQFRQVSNEISTFLSACESFEDADIYNPRITDLKVTTLLVLQFYRHIFTWSGFYEKQHQELLQKFLKCFSSPEISGNESQNQSLSQVSTTTMILDTIKNLFDHKSICLLSSACNLVKLLTGLQELMLYNKRHADKYITASGQAFLKKKWYTHNQVLETGKSTFESIEVFTIAYLKDFNMNKLMKVTTILQKEVKMLHSKKDTLTSFPCVDKSNIHVMYTCLIKKLLILLPQELLHINSIEQLKIWLTTLQSLESLINIAKFVRMKSVLKVCSRHAVRVLKTFINQGLPIVNSMLKEKLGLIQNIFGRLEIITKFLHQVCCESLVKKDANLQTPMIRSTLEELNNKIQAVMETHNCKQAFWTGILVNKTLNGETIASQIFTDSAISDSESIESDAESDNDIFDEAVQSSSEVFA